MKENTTRIVELPTGYLFNTQCSRGILETLSIGDYGKRRNIKADFLGYTRELNGVPNGQCLPLSEKWVITLSTQYGCPMKCQFCDVPNIPFKGNASFDDLKKQFYEAIKLFPSVSYTDRLNIHFARMGEPILNPNVFKFASWLYANKRQIYNDVGLRIETLHPVMTTSSPRWFRPLERRLLEWCEIKNGLYNGQAGLQLSINSTSDEQRDELFNACQSKLSRIAKIGEKLPMPVGRKYCLNFAYATGSVIDPVLLAKMFDREKFMVKLTPIHNNNACRKNGIETKDGYHSFTPYKEVEEGLKNVGFDVIIFVPSVDEEDGLVTCGNLVLGGGTVKTKSRLNIAGI